MSDGVLEMFRQKLNRLTISDYHGLNSPGLTCYLNSVLQVLFMTEDFREAVKRCNSKDSTTIDSHLGGLFTALERSTAKTHDITKKLGITDVCKQRDAAEYFEKIMCFSSPEASKMFKGELNHKTTCLKCNKRTDSRSLFWILPLAVKDSHHQSVDKGLKAFFKGEKVCGDNKLYCTRCNDKQDTDMECEITQHPEILTVLLKRFTYDYKHGCYVKLQSKVEVPQTLHVESYTYELYAFVNHFGNLRGGHYTAQIRSFENGEWYCFNDDIVERVKPPVFGAENTSVRSHMAYLLMYRKVSRHPEQTEKDDQEAPFTHSRVAAEGRRDEAQIADAFVPHHHLKDEGWSGTENWKHLNGYSHEDTGQWTSPFGELDKQPNQKAARVRPNREIWPQTHTAADVDRYRPRLQRQKSNNTTSQTQNNTVTPKTEDVSDTRSEKRTAMVVKNKTENPFPVSPSGCSCSAPYWTDHSQNWLEMKKPDSNAADLCRQLGTKNKNQEKVQRVVTADRSCKPEGTQAVTASLREQRDAKKYEVKRDPWRF